MILTLNDKREISQIIASLTDEDYEIIDKEVDRLCTSCSPIFTMLGGHKPDEFTKDAVEWLNEEDCDYQELAAEKMWDLFRPRVIAEYAFGVFRRRHSLGEAA